jgi:hypothetical protein
VLSEKVVGLPVGGALGPVVTMYWQPAVMMICTQTVDAAE